MGASNPLHTERRLVAGHKRDGRSVYNEAAKSELVALRLQSGALVSRRARECGVNANQVGRWLREQPWTSLAHRRDERADTAGVHGGT